MATGSSDSRRTRRRSGRPRVSVLRVGHRVGRDPRLTTHLALTARAFGADKMFLEPPDPELAQRVAALGRGWGGSFAVEGVNDWRGLVREFPGTIVHLTMYGEPFERALRRLRRGGPLLLVVGGAKVPPDLYRISDVNVAVGAQPHSEVAAVAVVLHRLVGIPDARSFGGALRRIVPRARGKRVVRREASR